MAKLSSETTDAVRKSYRILFSCLLGFWFVSLPTITTTSAFVVSNRQTTTSQTGFTLLSSSLFLKNDVDVSMIDDQRKRTTKFRKKKLNRRPTSKDKKSSHQYNAAMEKTDRESSPQTWRIYGVEVHPDDLKWDPRQEIKQHQQQTQSKQDNKSLFLHSAVLKALQHKYPGLVVDAVSVQVVRRSLDARRNKSRSDGRGRGPRFTYVLDVAIENAISNKNRLRHQPGKMERLHNEVLSTSGPLTFSKTENKKKRVIIVGAGPAGLFCALTLAQTGLFEPIVLERGQPVERRGRDIGALMHRRTLVGDSNFCFGEGGAGTWSDGKLTTRIGRNSQAVRRVLQTLVDHGAPEVILVHGAPHLGTDNLVKLLRRLRMELIELGGQVHFGATMTQMLFDKAAEQVDSDGTNTTSRVVGVEYQQTTTKQEDSNLEASTTTIKTCYGDAVVLATGHSARDVYQTLYENSPVTLQPKGFAVGFRVEHPQSYINEMQYGIEWGRSVRTGKSITDAANQEYFDQIQDAEQLPEHERLPVPSYRLATDKAWDGTSNRGVYSFCMCPGGQIVPASTDPKELCVNGMSFSRRDSVWANSALVVTVSPDDPVLEPYEKEHGVLAGVFFQQDMERRAAIMGGGNLTVPVQRVTDFIHGTVSSTVPTSSYRLGTKSSPCHTIYPPALTEAIQDALVNYFNVQMPGFVSEKGLLHAVETRTSSPVRIARNDQTMQALGIQGLFPAGEGAGFAGGIVSAAVDGLHVAEAIIDQLLKDDGGAEERATRQKLRRKSSAGDFY